MKRIMLVFVLVLASVWTSCGGGGGGGGSTDDGGTINEDWTVTELTCTGTVTGGTFSDDTGASIYVGSGELSTCVNATSDPTVQAASLPSGFDVHTTEGDINVTTGGNGYAFSINGDSGFTTTTNSAVTITLPFDTTNIPSADRTNATMIFVRIYTNDDSSLVDINGTISGNTITVETQGLPEGFTAAVIYNPNMRVAVSAPIALPSISSKTFKTMTNLPPWPGRTWCAYYNVSSTVLISAVKTKLGISTTPTPTQILNAITTYVVTAATEAQTIYETAGFRAPNLFVSTSASDPCGTNAYAMHVIEEGSNFQPNDPVEVITPEGNHYGRIYINAEDIKDPVAKGPGDTGSVKGGSVAHEMLHAIQNGYELLGITLKGYREGTATTYGMTIDQGGAITVRSYATNETELMTDFLTANRRGTDQYLAYANQDFFAYVAKEYASDSLGYLADLFEDLSDAIDTYSAAQTTTNKRAAYKKQPPRNILFEAMDENFGLTFGLTLNNIYLDFLKQRAFVHNASSQFGRNNETTSGFASELFQSSTTKTENGLVTVTVNADTCNVIDGSGTFANVSPYAARALEIITSTASTTGKKLTITLTPATGAVGSTWGGSYYHNGATTALSGNETVINTFGTTEDDEVDIAFANITTDTPMYVQYQVTCGDTPTPPATVFTVTNFSLPSVTFSPQYESTFAWGGFVAVDVSELTQADSAWASQKYLQIQFVLADISGPGTYTISGCYYDSGGHGNAAMLFQVVSGGAVYCATSGTLTLTAFDSAAGSHITGNFSVNMEDIYNVTSTGSISADFDLTVGDSNVPTD